MPIKANSRTGLYCSHVLEHLSLRDFRIALMNSYKILEKGGIFRCVLPDLETAARSYIRELDDKNHKASIDFMENTLLGVRDRPRGIKGFISAFFRNSHHLWMWDAQSLSEELKNAGFTQIRACRFNDSEDEMFKYVEDAGRFENAIAFECRK